MAKKTKSAEKRKHAMEKILDHKLIEAINNGTFKNTENGMQIWMDWFFGRCDPYIPISHQIMLNMRFRDKMLRIPIPTEPEMQSIIDHLQKIKEVCGVADKLGKEFVECDNCGKDVTTILKRTKTSDYLFCNKNCEWEFERLMGDLDEQQ